MSKLSVKTIRPKTGSAVQIASNTSIALGDNAFASSKGTPVQFVTARYDGRQSFTAGPGFTPNQMPNTNISIIPKYTGSLLSVKWMLSGEVHQDVVSLNHTQHQRVLAGVDIVLDGMIETKVLLCQIGTLMFLIPQ